MNEVNEYEQYSSVIKLGLLSKDALKRIIKQVVGKTLQED